MVNYTNEQIEQIAECHIKRRCYDCPLGKEDIYQLNKSCSVMIAELTLDLISRHEVEKRELRESVDCLRAASAELYDAFEENQSLKTEVDRLKSMNQAKLDLIHDLLEDIEGYKAELESEHLSRMDNIRELTSELKTTKSEAIKEYKSRVENDIITLLSKLNCNDFLECLDYRYKEMAGEGE